MRLGIYSLFGDRPGWGRAGRLGQAPSSGHVRVRTSDAICYVFGDLRMVTCWSVIASSDSIRVHGRDPWDGEAVRSVCMLHTAI